VTSQSLKSVFRNRLRSLSVSANNAIALWSALCSTGFTYRLYRLQPRASRSKGASNKLWYA